MALIALLTHTLRARQFVDGYGGAPTRRAGRANHYAGDRAREAALACDENPLAAGVNLSWALYSTGRFAEAIAVYGAEQGEAIEAVADLEALAERGIRPQAVREILDTYWPK